MGQLLVQHGLPEHRDERGAPCTLSGHKTDTQQQRTNNLARTHRFRAGGSTAATHAVIAETMIASVAHIE